MTKYIYKDPLIKGYKKFKLSKKQHNKLFQYRQLKWFDKYEYYYNDKEIILHKFYNPLFITINIIISPIGIFIAGLMNIKQYWQELKQMCNQKKYGQFSGDSVWKESNLYIEIMKIIELNEKGE